MPTVTTKDLAKLSCEDLAQLERILILMGKHDAAKKVREVAMKRGCPVTTASPTSELIL